MKCRYKSMTFPRPQKLWKRAEDLQVLSFYPLLKIDARKDVKGAIVLHLRWNAYKLHAWEKGSAKMWPQMTLMVWSTTHAYLGFIVNMKAF